MSGKVQYWKANYRRRLTYDKWKKQTVKNAMNLGATAAIAGTRNAIQYMTNKEKKKYSGSKKRKSRRVKTTSGRESNIFSDKVGSSKLNYNGFTLKTVQDILFPVIRENYQEQGSQLDWSAGQQNVKIYHHLDVAKVKEMIKKGRDNNIAVTTPFSESNDAENLILNYVGGYQRHTFINNSTNSAVMFLYTVTAKKYTQREPLRTWDECLDHNEPLGTNAPVDLNPNTNGFPGANYPFRKQHVLMHHYFKKLSVKKVVLEPGEQYVHTMYHRPFTIGSKKLTMSLTDEYLSGSESPTYGYFTNFLLTVTYSQLVTDSADSGINYGSGAIGHLMQEQNIYRSVFPHRPYQEIHHGTLDTITGTEQHIDPTERELQAYTEA